MKEQLISFETAKLAHDVGFRDHSKFPESITIVTQALLQKGLREIHGVHVTPRLQTYPNNYYCEINAKILDRPLFIKDFETGMVFITYEEALETGLQDALNLINT